MLFTNFSNYLKTKRGVFHIGANDGAERDWYQQQRFSPVLWFEPNRDVFLKLQNNISNRKNDRCYNIGIHDTLKSAVLHIASNKGQSSSILNFGTHKKYRPDIKYIQDQRITLMRMDTFIKEQGIDMRKFNFLNIDVQGVELSVIKSFGKLISKLDYIYTEVNEEQLYENCCLVGEIDAYLQPFGFERKETVMTPHKWGDALYVKKNVDEI